MADAPLIWIPGDRPESLEAFNKREYGDAQHERKPHGIIFADGKEVAVTLQCPHCGGHFMSRKGSGHRRIFCMYHMAVCCGQEGCPECPKLAGEIKMGMI